MKNCVLILCVLFISACHASENNIDTAIAKYIQGEMPNYEVAYHDLNADGFNDAFVYLNDRNWCGSGGCTSLIFKGTPTGFVFFSKIMIVNKPIMVTTSTTATWFDIVVNTGNIGPVILVSNGIGYPLNPSLQPKVNNKELPKGTYLFD